MITGLAQVALLVLDYEETLSFYSGKLGFSLVEDTSLKEKRWIRLRAPGGSGSDILLSKVISEEQRRVVGNQAGGRVLFFMYTDDLKSEYERLQLLGVEFCELPRKEIYGHIAVFKDLYGNRIDLIEPSQNFKE